MKINTSLHQTQRQVLSPMMQQSIELLMLPITELNTAIEQELQGNPLLEINEEVTTPTQSQIDEIIRRRLESLPREQGFLYTSHHSDDEIFEEKPFSIETSLEDKLMQQLRIEFSDPLELKIGEFIIGNLNEDGYLKLTCEEIAEELSIDDIPYVEKILKVVQGFDPTGIASRNLKECLLSQVHIHSNGHTELVTRIIEGYLSELGSKKHQEIAQKLKVSIEDVKMAVKIISRFEPKPARNFRPVSSSIYIKPDVTIAKDENGNYQVQVNDESIPPLRINSYYRKMLERSVLTDAERDFVRDKLKRAVQFIKNIEHRGYTIRRIAQYILNKQKDFFEYDSKPLIPMTLKDVAQAVDRNESTVSRAVNSKYIDTPKGLFRLKFFFSQGYVENGSGLIASRSIKEEIQGLINDEDKTSPLSDHEIQQHFVEKDMKIARRTVSKYRHSLNILPSHLRKE